MRKCTPRDNETLFNLVIPELQGETMKSLNHSAEYTKI